MNGNDGNNVLDGRGGADQMYGGLGDDIYYVDDIGDQIRESAASGHDHVYASVSFTLSAYVEDLTITGDAQSATGNGSANHIVGNAGDNIIAGKGGNDLLHGNGGSDTFVFDTKLGSGNVDTINDFGAGDSFKLDHLVFAGLTPGPLAAGKFQTGAAAHDANDRIIYDASNGHIYYDADGTGSVAQVLFAIVTPHTDLHASDFLVI
jgi:serralysin